MARGDQLPPQFKAFLQERFPSTSEQQGLGKLVEALREQPGWRLIEEVLDWERERKVIELGRQVHAHETYAYGHGMLHGLGLAQATAHAIVAFSRDADGRAQRAAERHDTEE